MMAQIVSYWQNNVEFTEGPFVLVNINGWRIEVELKGHKCPVFLDSSICEFCLLHNKPRRKTNNFQVARRTCDWLNEQVRHGKIVLKGRAWVAQS